VKSASEQAVKDTVRLSVECAICIDREGLPGNDNIAKL
jgi:hypothetical protein